MVGRSKGINLLVGFTPGCLQGPLDDVWRHGWLSPLEWGLLLTSSGSRPGTLLSTSHPPQQRTTQSKMSLLRMPTLRTASRVKNPHAAMEDLAMSTVGFRSSASCSSDRAIKMPLRSKKTLNTLPHTRPQ